MLARFAFSSPNFLERLKKDFMKKFDADKNGYLDQKEMIRFLAYHVRTTLLPRSSFFDFVFFLSAPLQLVGREKWRRACLKKLQCRVCTCALGASGRSRCNFERGWCL